MTQTTFPDHILDQARNADVLALAEKRVQLRRESANEYAGPCPKCGGSDRLHVKVDGFFCRQCHPKWGDAIEYVRWLDGFDFVRAVEHLTGYRKETGRTMTQPNAPVAQRQPAPAKPEAQTQPWIAKANVLVNNAHKLLFDDNAAALGQAYLIRRGIEPHTWMQYKLGYRQAAALPGTWDRGAKQYIIPGKPAIVIPWYRGGEVWGLRFRFLEAHTYTDIDGRERTEKQSAQTDSIFSGGLYGGHALPFSGLPDDGSGTYIESLRTLLICEGEINAISIWQVTEPWNWDVFSLGSESQRLGQAAIDIAKRYERVLIWMDRAEIARSLMATIPGAYGVNSPNKDGKKQDANDMLQATLLGGFLATVRLMACKSDIERQRHHWNLFDASQRPPFLDAGTAQVLKEIESRG